MHSYLEESHEEEEEEEEESEDSFVAQPSFLDERRSVLESLSGKTLLYTAILEHFTRICAPFPSNNTATSCELAREGKDSYTYDQHPTFSQELLVTYTAAFLLEEDPVSLLLELEERVEQDRPS